MPRAAYACDPDQSRGRLFPEPPSALRTAFARDRDRIIHCTAFRRLRSKTQVFVAPGGDHFRVRLTHSLEVAQIARTIARALGLDEDLTEALALAHDIGHPPFGHSGEDALQEAMAPVGGFDHNGHAIRILTRLEERHPAYAGLNLSWETLEGLAKHNGPVRAPGWALAEYDALHPLALDTHAGLEAQVAALADDIAYNAHDLDDGLRAGLLDLDEARGAVPLLADGWAAVERRWPGEGRRRLLVAELVRDLIGLMVESLLAETHRRLAELAPRHADDVRQAARPMVAFPRAVADRIAPLRSFLHSRFYRHAQVMRMRGPATEVIARLYAHLNENPADLPPRWQREWPAETVAQGRRVGDYVAGMTDRFAIRECWRLTGHAPAGGHLALEGGGPFA